MFAPEPEPTPTSVLLEQQAYYRAVAETYEDYVIADAWDGHVEAALDAFAPTGRVVAKALKPDGRVFFVDDAFRTPDELVYGDTSPLVRRRLRDGSEYTVVKVPREPASLERRLHALG